MNLSTKLTKFTLSSGVTYGYVYIPPQSAKTTILFLHGFPSGAYDWRHQIPYFSAAGFGVIVPDLLGYGSTDKPEAAEAYKGKKMASEIIEILDHEKINKVHGVGHDWGSYLLSRLANYHSNRFFSFSFLDVAYMPPGIKFDVEAANAESKDEVGYERLGFWKFLIEDDAVAILKEHVFDSLPWFPARADIVFIVRLLPFSFLSGRSTNVETASWTIRCNESMAGSKQDWAISTIYDSACKFDR